MFHHYVLSSDSDPALCVADPTGPGFATRWIEHGGPLDLCVHRSSFTTIIRRSLSRESLETPPGHLLHLGSSSGGPPPPMRLSDMLKRKRVSSRKSSRKSSGGSTSRDDPLASSSSSSPALVTPPSAMSTPSCGIRYDRYRAYVPVVVLPRFCL